jgi:hypothetical protein
VSDAAFLDRLSQLLPPGSKTSDSPLVDMLYSLVVGGAGPRPGVRRFHVAYEGGARITRTHDLEVGLSLLADRVSKYVAVWARRRVFVHAGVVAWEGRAILIPGRTMSGKSWLVRALVRAGAEYYSDEFAVLDRRGRVHPYPLPLSIRGPDGHSAPAVESLGGRTGRKPLPVALVALTRYVPGRTWRPRVLTQGRAVLELLNHTVSARRVPGRALEALTRAVSQARVVKGARGEADEAVREILDVDRWPRPQPAPSSAPVRVPKASPVCHHPPLMQEGRR